MVGDCSGAIPGKESFTPKSSQGRKKMYKSERQEVTTIPALLNRPDMILP